MRRISIVNFKGGVGKSSVVENLSHALSAENKTVLVVDCDRQANSSTTLLGEPASAPTLTEALKGEVPLSEVIRHGRAGVDVVPSNGDLETAAAYILSHRAAYYSLRRAVEKLSYDIVLYDHAGAYTPVMEAALLASSEILVPCELESYAVVGLFQMFAKLQEMLVDHELRNSGILPYAVDLRYAMSRQYLNELRQAFGELILAPIRTDATVPRAQSVRQTVFEYDPKSRVAEDFRTLAADLIEEEV